MDQHFLSQPNVEMLWEVLMDEDVLKNKPNEIITQINQVFHKNIRPFYDSERKNTNNLMELNKKFIGLIISFVNKKYSTIQTPAQPQPQSHPQAQREQYVTHEDIQANRMSQFESQYNLKQQEFKKAMSLPVPETPKFSDKIDEPLGEMEVVLKRTMAQRNYDIEQLNKNNPNTLTPNQIENFLKPQETSIKNEKLPPNVNININTNNTKQQSNNNIQNHNHNNHNHNNTERKIKHIKIEENVDSHVLDNEIIEIKEPVNQMKREKDSLDINNEIYKRMQMYDKPPTQSQISQPYQSQNKHITWGPDEHFEHETYNMEIGIETNANTINGENNVMDDDLGLLFKKLKPAKKIELPQSQTIQTISKLTVEERLDKLESMLAQILNKLQ